MAVGAGVGTGSDGVPLESQVPANPIQFPLAGIDAISAGGTVCWLAISLSLQKEPHCVSSAEISVRWKDQYYDAVLHDGWAGQ